MKKIMRINQWYSNWKSDLLERKYLILLSILFVFIAELVCFYTSTYVDRINVVSVPDIILDNIPTMNFEIFYVYGFMFVLFIALIYTFMFKLKEIHNIALLFGLLILVRAIFITLTHLGVPENARVITHAPNFFRSLNFNNDLFFSGHAAMPFMGFLIFRKEAINIFFLVMSMILSITVLVMHAHYTIDVISAFFITYGVYAFGTWLNRNINLSIKKRNSV